MSLEYLKEAIIRVCLQMNTVINTNSNNFCFSALLSCPQERAFFYIYDVQIVQIIFTTTTRWTLFFMRFFFFFFFLIRAVLCLTPRLNHHIQSFWYHLSVVHKMCCKGVHKGLFVLCFSVKWRLHLHYCCIIRFSLSSITTQPADCINSLSWTINHHVGYTKFYYFNLPHMFILYKNDQLIRSLSSTAGTGVIIAVKL